MQELRRTTLNILNGNRRLGDGGTDGTSFDDVNTARQQIFLT